MQWFQMAQRMQIYSAVNPGHQWHQPLVNAVGRGVENGSCHQVLCLLTPLLLCFKRKIDPCRYLMFSGTVGRQNRPSLTPAAVKFQPKRKEAASIFSNSQAIAFQNWIENRSRCVKVFLKSLPVGKGETVEATKRVGGWISWWITMRICPMKETQRAQ